MSKAVELFKLGLHEVPHLMFTGFIFVVGTALSAVNIHRDYKYEFAESRWKKRYTVYREGDPRAARQINPITHKIPLF